MARRRGVRIILSGVCPDVMHTLVKFGVDKELGSENIFDNIIPALKVANSVADEAKVRKG